MTRSFPDGFLWGVSTASYQVEGAVNEDGRVPSIWDTFAHTPGKVTGGDTSDVACDVYHRYASDIEQARQLGVGAFRFSVSWPRVMGGRVNRAGLDYYDRVVDCLCAAGIAPVVTLYHWDLPQYLQDAGGWPSRDTAYYFSDYVTAVAGTLGDRVAIWTTLNEPWCSAFLGYASGDHAPGVTNPAASLAAAHHLNLAHGLAAQAVRAVLPSARISVSLNLSAVHPVTDSPADQAAAARVERVANDIWLLPMLEGHYDQQLFADTAAITNWSFVRDGDLAQVHQPLDVLGVNYYSPTYVKARPAGEYFGPFPGCNDVEFMPPTPPLTAMGWSQEPAALTGLLTGLARGFEGLDLMVTENGAAFDDVVGQGDKVHDPARVGYLDAHINAVADAIDAGAPVKGYFLWSLLDNFEWACGYSRRFGLLRTDFTTQQRTWKDSAFWYQNVASSNRLP